MLTPPLIQTVQQLHLAGKSNREISNLLKISRNTVRKIVQNKNVDKGCAPSWNSRDEELIQLIIPLLKSCRGNLVRVHEILAQQYDVSIAYSSLTYLVRKHHLREPVKRAGEYYFDPGVEMQHDTSPHQVVIAGKTIKAQCASLVLAFSRKLFIQYYPCYTRFEAKNFLRQALLFMQGSCQRCVIDNTSVILAAGAGKYAVITPEMVFFSRIFGFEFIAHAVNHPDRKGRVERPFAYAENNFLAGRSFNDWHDLNQQALQWCETVANSKHKKSLGMTPESAYIQEKPALQLLPKVLPPIYEHCQRIVDTQGFVNIDTNRYSMPESLIGNTVDIYKYLEEIEIHFQHHFIARHSRLLEVRPRFVSKGDKSFCRSAYTQFLLQNIATQPRIAL